jgi:rare lipoprotein A
MRRLTLVVITALIMVLGLAPAAHAYGALASYYGYELAGNATASGEAFNPEEYTAASPHYPFGTLLTVCYYDCVQVRVNDRGPYYGGREIDLSQGAADAIGLTYVGVDYIEVYEIWVPPANIYRAYYS